MVWRTRKCCVPTITVEVGPLCKNHSKITCRTLQPRVFSVPLGDILVKKKSLVFETKEKSCWVLVTCRIGDKIYSYSLSMGVIHTNWYQVRLLDRNNVLSSVFVNSSMWSLDLFVLVLPKLKGFISAQHHARFNIISLLFNKYYLSMLLSCITVFMVDINKRLELTTSQKAKHKHNTQNSISEYR